MPSTPFHAPSTGHIHAAPTPHLTFSSPAHPSTQATSRPGSSPTTPLWPTRGGATTSAAFGCVPRKRARACTPPVALTPGRQRTVAQAAQSASAQRTSEAPSKCASVRRLARVLDKEEQAWERAFPVAPERETRTGKRTKHNSPFSPPGSPSWRMGKRKLARACHGPGREGKEEEQGGGEDEGDDGDEDEDNDDVFSPRSPTARMCMARRRSADADPLALPLPALRPAVSPASLAHLRALSAAQLRWAEAAQGTPLQARPGEDRDDARRSLSLLRVEAADVVSPGVRVASDAGSGEEEDSDLEGCPAAQPASPTPTRSRSARAGRSHG